MFFLAMLVQESTPCRWRIILPAVSVVPREADAGRKKSNISKSYVILGYNWSQKNYFFSDAKGFFFQWYKRKSYFFFMDIKRKKRYFFSGL